MVRPEVKPAMNSQGTIFLYQAMREGGERTKRLKGKPFEIQCRNRQSCVSK